MNRRLLYLSYIVGTSIIAMIMFFLVAYVAADAALQPDPPKNTPYLDQFPFPVEEIDFEARDKTSLAGWFLAAAPPPGEAPTTTPNATVILMHGYGGTRDVMLPYASFLSDAGFHVFFFDARGVGHSARVEVTFGEREKLDVLGAIDYLSKRPDVDQKRVAIMGLELGGRSASWAPRRISGSRRWSRRRRTPRSTLRCRTPSTRRSRCRGSCAR